MHTHGLAERRAVGHLRELSEEAFISYSRGESTGINFAVANACRVAGFSPKIVHEATQIQTAISLVAAGMGVALVPSLHSRVKNRKVRFLALQGRSPSLDIGLAIVYNATSETEIGKTFRDFCLQLLEKA
ncbi:MAG: LysR family substrate-binding domain-containing protein [Bradyrhizobium sp.]|uniref:LysR family substrate-binding domain-containing protein n=1 Tax=Bradyrhizobium sp. TaxID=376 RepID=UPI001DBDC3C9|nr:LysR family substrate-binding domain-containing protein [Bradyrhizobium sp.]MBV9564246.1 LysR family substrate-binding domain-containing protein [Bradyrhizobium sp.]